MSKKFQVIANSYDRTDKVLIANNLREKLASISAALKELDGVQFVVEDFYLTKSTESNEFQWRATCYVNKTNRKVSWSDIYWAINTISIPVYESVPKEHVQNLIDSQLKQLADLREMLGVHFASLVMTPIDDVGQFMIKGLTEHARNRRMPGWDGIQAVAKLKALSLMPRQEIRAAATSKVNELITAAA